MRTEGNGGRPPQEIQAEIDRARREMDGTLTAIEHRLSPGQLIDQGMSYLRQNGAHEFVSNLSGQAKQNPMPVALVGIGIAWLMASGKLSTASEAGSSKLGDAKDKLNETASAVRGQATKARDSLDTMMREQPLALGALGLALGALTAALAPRTEMEDRIAGPARDRMTEKAAEELKSRQPEKSASSQPVTEPVTSARPGTS